MDRVSDYIVSKLAVAGIVARAASADTSDDGVVVEIQVNIATAMPWTLWIRCHQRGYFRDKIEILGFSDPFEVDNLIEIGPHVIGKILMYCDAQAS